jgi:hypothetical protein
MERLIKGGLMGKYEARDAEAKTNARFVRALKCTANILDASEMLYLAQLISADEYFANNTNNGEDCFFTTREYIQEEIGISPKIQKRCEKNLVLHGLIRVMGMPYEANRYQINYRRIDELEEEYEKRHADMIERRSKRKLESCRLKHLEETKEASRYWKGENQGDDEAGLGAADGNPGDAIMASMVDPLDGANNNINITNNNNKISSTTRINVVEDAYEFGVAVSNELNAQQSLNGIYPDEVSRNLIKNQSLRSIVDAYNQIMGRDYAIADMKAAVKREDELRSVQGFINPVALPFIWSDIADDGTRRKVKDKSIAAFLGFDLPKQILAQHERVQVYCDLELDIKLDSLFWHNQEIVASCVEGTEYGCDKMGGLYPTRKGDSFPKSAERKLRRKILQKRLMGMLPEEEKEAITILMEAFDAVHQNNSN